MARVLLLALGLLLAAAQCAVAAAAPASVHATHAGVGRGHVSPADWQFMRQAAAANLAAMAAGKLAVAGAHERALHDFGATVVEDHLAINRRLSLLTLDKQVPLPTRATAAERKALARVKDGPPATFDQALAAHLAEVQQRIVELFRREAAAAQADPALRTFAQESLPVLQAHVQRARQLAAAAVAH